MLLVRETSRRFDFLQEHDSVVSSPLMRQEMPSGRTLFHEPLLLASQEDRVDISPYSETDEMVSITHDSSNQAHSWVSVILILLMLSKLLVRGVSHEYVSLQVLHSEESSRVML